CLVTGGAGYIGSHVAWQLIEAGHEVVVLDNLSMGHRWAVPSGATLVEGNVGDVATLEKVFTEHKIDAVLHFAAAIEVPESVEQPIEYYRNNTLSALNLFDTANRFDVQKIVFSSTAAAYGETGGEPISESTPVMPVNPYGRSKVFSENILRDLADSTGGKLRYVILRYFNVAGARLDLKIGQARPKPFHLINLAAEAAIGLRASLSVFGNDYPTPDGTCLRDYIHVEDLADAHLKALKYLDDGGQSDLFNVGYGKPYSVHEVINAMKKASGVDFKVEAKPRRAGDPAAIIADSSKLKSTLNWHPKYNDMNIICKTALDWERKYRAEGLDKK
ncbi:MAG: UDP-glucose 4-epimerase GalE, partial [Proteobacteria bacterium]